MELTQDVTLKLTEADCRNYVIELGELEGIADSLSPGGLNTMTGLVTLRNLRDLLERHGLGVRQQVLENEVAYIRSLPAQPGYGPWVQR
jgi:hypothetical protein